MMRAMPLQLAQLLAAFLAIQPTSAQKVNLHEIQEAQQQFHNNEHAMSSPFLSATLKTEISPVSSYIKLDQKKLLSSSLVTFLQHIFDDQQVFDVEIVGVAIFEEQLVQNDRRRLEMQQQQNRRKLPLNTLQKGQFHFERGDDDESGDDENEDEENEDDHDEEESWDELESLVEEKTTEGYTLTFATVVSAEHKQQQSLSHGDFQTMLIHICHKFDSHLVEFVKGVDDAYFTNVESVVVSGYEDQNELEMGQQEGSDGSNNQNDGNFDNIESLSRDEGGESKLNAASIVAIALSILLLVPLAFAFVKFRRREQRLNANRRWRSQEIATANNANNSSIKSLRILTRNSRIDDDYSFDPLGTDNGYTGNAIPRFYNNTTRALPKGERPIRDETVSFGNQPPTSSSSSLFQQPSMNERPNETSSAIKSLPLSLKEQQHIFAPPGKVGVAIDVVNGNPVVHKVKKGSPLQGLLQPNDLIMAIDDIDTTCMSAADVTHLMVKRMNYQRKITFVRRNDA